MKTYYLRQTQFLPIDIITAWDFFSSAGNLSVITPPRMRFKILTRSGEEKMHEGQIITYRVSILPFVRVGWTTRITQVRYPDSFTDEQLAGPYKVWRHKHTFNRVEGGVEMTDQVEYVVPMGLLGRAANSIFVRRELEKIFNYRLSVLETHFKKDVKLR
jgi:ligand-binding SRPBCC domain-containing protein